MVVEFHLLGDVQADIDGRLVEFGHARQRCVLATLLLEANQVIRGAELVSRVWSDRQLPTHPANALQTYLTLLRRAFNGSAEVAIEWQSPGYRLIVDPKVVDVHRFRDLLTDAHSVTADERKADLIEQALRLWRGEPFATLDTSWLNTVRATLEKQRYTAQLDLTDIQLRRGQHAMLVPSLYDLAGAHPFDERLAGQLMLALHRSGRTSDALSYYQDIRRRLTDELGIDPGPQLRTLHQQVLSAHPVLDAPVPEVTIRSAKPVVPQQLPAPPRLFAGRALEFRRLDIACAVAGLVVISAISGTGGIGKSWLALHWAHSRIDRFTDGQLFANLRGFDPSGEPTSPGVVLRGFLEALGVAAEAIPNDPDARAALYRSLVSGRRMLIVLDNARDSRHVEALLPGCPSCTVLITSRRHLGGLVARYGADAVELDVLSESEAGALLSRHLGVGRTAAEPEATADLVTACAGLPLALGIVAVRAARNPRFPLAVLADELREAAARLDALDGGELNINLRAVLSWSLDALDAGSRGLFACLGLVPGPDIDLAAVVSLAGLPESLVRNALRDLENANLVQQHRPGRYRMHDLVRLHAAERAAVDLPPESRIAALRRLVDFYLNTAVAGELLLNPHRDPVDVAQPAPACHPMVLWDQAEAMRWFEAEHHCLLAVQQSAAEQGWHAAVWQLPWALCTFHRRHGHFHQEYLAWQAALVAAELSDTPAARVLTHRRLALVCARIGRQTDGIDHLNRALALAERTGDLRGQAHTHQAFGLVWEVAGNDRAALAHLTRALRLFHAVGTPAQKAEVRNGLGWHLARLGRYRQARTQCELALSLLRSHNHTDGLVNTLDSLRYVSQQLGEWDQAIDYGRQALAICRAFGHSFEEANVLDHIASAHLAFGQHGQARQCWEQAYELYQAQHRATDARRIQRHLAGLERISP
jgi:DNA-binding SARP family transcriptional activator/tetratricopeptide (TPR) repeat protein